MLDLTRNDPIIKTYLNDIQHLESQQVSHELGLKVRIRICWTKPPEAGRALLRDPSTPPVDAIITDDEPRHAH